VLPCFVDAVTATDKHKKSQKAVKPTVYHSTAVKCS